MSPQPKSTWPEWFAWYPVLVHGNRVWLKTVYRRKVEWNNEWDGTLKPVPPPSRLIREGISTSDTSWEYGTLFDILGA